MNLSILAKLGFIERRGDVVLEGPLLDLLMDTDLLKERIINGALADVFKRTPPQEMAVPRRPAKPRAYEDDAPNAVETTEPEMENPDYDADGNAVPVFDVPLEAPLADDIQDTSKD